MASSTTAHAGRHRPHEGVGGGHRVDGRGAVALAGRSPRGARSRPRRRARRRLDGVRPRPCVGAARRTSGSSASSVTAGIADHARGARRRCGRADAGSGESCTSSVPSGSGEPSVYGYTMKARPPMSEHPLVRRQRGADGRRRRREHAGAQRVGRREARRRRVQRRRRRRRAEGLGQRGHGRRRRRTAPTSSPTTMASLPTAGSGEQVGQLVESRRRRPGARSCSAPAPAPRPPRRGSTSGRLTNTGPRGRADGVVEGPAQDRAQLAQACAPRGPTC